MKKQGFAGSTAVIGCGFFVLGLFGCAHPKPKLVAESDLRDSVAASRAPGLEARPMLASEPFVGDKLLRAVPELETVHFDFDDASLKPAEGAILAKNAEWLRSRPKIQVQVTGHCDQRGTIEYNLALGQRRAKAVRDYYIKLGIPGNRIATISYGSERPACRESSEDCWQANRRARTLEILVPKLNN